MAARILIGDCLETLRTLPAACVQCVVTSPPYFGLRDYGVAGQVGQEATPEAYVARLVEVFREVRRALRDDGTVWLNLGDSYAGNNGFRPNAPSNQRRAAAGSHTDGAFNYSPGVAARQPSRQRTMADFPGHKPKDLLGMPWAVAFALRADGWFLRSAIVWAKPNPMPEAVRDRPTGAYELVFLLAKSGRYFYDAAAIAEPAMQPAGTPKLTAQHKSTAGGYTTNGTGASSLGSNQGAATRNARNVWTIAPRPYKGAHFAVMPPALAERCIRAGSRPGDTVLDPFAGAGTTGVAAEALGRDAILCELNPEYAALASGRLAAAPPLAEAAE